MSFQAIKYSSELGIVLMQKIIKPTWGLWHDGTPCQQAREERALALLRLADQKSLRQLHLQPLPRSCLFPRSDDSISTVGIVSRGTSKGPVVGSRSDLCSRFSFSMAYLFDRH